MDDYKRSLERTLQANPGNNEVRRKLDNLKLQIGETPSWDFLLEEEERVKKLQQQHLLEAVKREFLAFFQKHPDSGIKELSWGIYDRADCGSYDFCPDNWDIEGLIINIDNGIWDEHCNVTPYGGCTGDVGQDFEAPTLISHLKGTCDCRKSPSALEEPDRCWVGMFEWVEDNQKQALCSALEDTIVLAKKLNRTRRELVHEKAVNFICNPKEFKAETLAEARTRWNGE